MSGSGAQGMKLNPKLFLVDVRSFADSAQLSSAIGKSSRIFVIFSSKSKLWTVGLADPDWLAIWRGSVQLGWWTLRTWDYPSEFGCLAESRRKRKTAAKALVKTSSSCRRCRQKTRSRCHCKRVGAKVWTCFFRIGWLTHWVWSF